ncbi:hypothetical protein [Paucimonas lemoignei]|uniref:hypothetical protein n=1 Tax=Paucimonas lemoignei TaxID=29443 RepID=UPI00104648E8|nr:hypothetical protein [Paucimonas lemoignei]
MLAPFSDEVGVALWVAIEANFICLHCSHKSSIFCGSLFVLTWLIKLMVRQILRSLITGRQAIYLSERKIYWRVKINIFSALIYAATKRVAIHVDALIKRRGTSGLSVFMLQCMNNQ